MLKVIEDIRPAFDKGELSVIVLIDFSIAFDTVNFNIADDAQIYLPRPPGLVQDLEARLNEDLYKICKWADQQTYGK